MCRIRFDARCVLRTAVDRAARGGVRRACFPQWRVGDGWRPPPRTRHIRQALPSIPPTPSVFSLFSSPLPLFLFVRLCPVSVFVPASCAWVRLSGASRKGKCPCNQRLDCSWLMTSLSRTILSTSATTAFATVDVPSDTASLVKLVYR